MESKNEKVLTRRAFTQRAALLSASAGLLPANFAVPAHVSAIEAGQLPEHFPKLSAAGQTEAESRYQMTLNRWGARLNEEEKSTLKLLCYSAQPGLEHVRAFALSNGDAPALVLHPLVGREKPASSKKAAVSAATSPKKP